MEKFTFLKSLMEAPLPDDWDKEVFTPKTSFKKRIEYAKKMATRLGAGSSRIAFIIPYEGRDTVLKVAKNRKGISQNEEEINLLQDYYIRNLELAIPIIDGDEKHFTWLHVEKAEKRATDGDFKRLTGLSLRALIDYASHVTGREKLYDEKRFEGVDDDSELVRSLCDLFGSYDNILTSDFRRLANWGIYKGRPVIIDLGLTDTSWALYK